MSDEYNEVLVCLTEEKASMWIKLCRTIVDSDPPKSLAAACDRISIQLTRALTQSKAS